MTNSASVLDSIATKVVDDLNARPWVPDDIRRPDILREIVIAAVQTFITFSDVGEGETVETVEPTFVEWARVELMGHITMHGRVTEEERFGTTMGRCDVPTSETEYATTYFSGSSVYRVIPLTEARCRAAARPLRQPIQRLGAPRFGIDSPSDFDVDLDDPHERQS